MKKNIKDAIIITLPFAIFFFILAFVTNLIEDSLIAGFFNGITGFILFGGLLFLGVKSAVKNKVNFKWWQWIIFSFGWILGIFNIIFWAIMLALHYAKNYNQKFFNKDFHKRVYLWGIVMIIVLAIIFNVIFLTYQRPNIFSI